MNYIYQTTNIFEAIHFNVPIVFECYANIIKCFCYHDTATDWQQTIKWHSQRHPRPVYCFMDVREISHPIIFDRWGPSHLVHLPFTWNNLGVDPKQILFLGNQHSIVDHKTVQYLLGLEIHTEWIRYFEADCVFRHTVQESFDNRQGPNHQTLHTLMSHDKKYLAMFGKPRKFMRAGALIKMSQMNMIDDSVVGCLVSHQGIDQVVKSCEYWPEHELRPILEKYSGSADNIEYDSPHTDNSNYRGYPYDPSLYKDTALSIVAETNDVKIPGVEQSTAFWITEKICRAMYNYHPFVVLSTPKFLQNLKSYGYKTFNSIVDESYDEMIDPYRRLQTALESAQDLYDNYTSTLIKDIVVHNHQQLHRVYIQTIERLFSSLNHISSIK